MPGYFYFAPLPTLAIFPSPRRDISPGNLRVANGVHNEAEMAWRADGPGICLPSLPSFFLSPLLLLSFACLLACLLTYLLACARSFANLSGDRHSRMISL